MPGPVFKTGEGSGNRPLVGSIPMHPAIAHVTIYLYFIVFACRDWHSTRQYSGWVTAGDSPIM